MTIDGRAYDMHVYITSCPENPVMTIGASGRFATILPGSIVAVSDGEMEVAGQCLMTVRKDNAVALLIKDDSDLEPEGEYTSFAAFGGTIRVWAGK